jgi:hypothetical protein
VPAIRGLDDKLYIVDHHHLCKAAMMCGVDKVYVDVLQDWSHLSYNDFWKQMSDNHYVWLFDDAGHPISLEVFPKSLPSSIRGMKDDPYRSLAGLVRKAGGYKKEDTPFSEFKWANIFRQQNMLEHDVKWDIAVQRALIVCLYSTA